jgi:hypothetical protein
MNTEAPSSTDLLIPSLHSLLHSIRCIAQHEDALCELLHELHHTTIAQAKFIAELRDLLEDIPAHDYVDDLDAVRDILGQTQIPAKQQRRGPKRPRAAAARHTQSRSSGTSRKPTQRKNTRSTASRRTASPKARRKPSR